MATKFDRKAAMRSSITSEKQNVADRFAVADKVLQERPAGLAAPGVPAMAIADVRHFSAEIRTPGSRQIVSALINRVHDNPYNARHIYNQDTVKSLAASLATHGQMVPAPAVPHATIEGDYTLLDGHYRKKGLIAAGKDNIELMILDHASALEMYRTSWLLNEERSAQSALDNALAWQSLLTQGLVKEAQQIAELVGVSPATVNKTLSLLKLPQPALDRIREKSDKFGVAIGYELSLASKKIEEGDLLNLITKIVDEDLSSRDVQAIREKLEKGGERKQKEVSRQYKIRNGVSQIGVIKEWDSGKVALEVNIIDPKERAALVEELKKRFNLED